MLMITMMIIMIKIIECKFRRGTGHENPEGEAETLLFH
jgi:hypothetical protein